MPKYVPRHSEPLSPELEKLVEDDRRAFLATCGRFAVVTPPVISLLLSTSLSGVAIAKSGGGAVGGGGQQVGSGGQRSGGQAQTSPADASAQHAQTTQEVAAEMPKPPVQSNPPTQQASTTQQIAAGKPQAAVQSNPPTQQAATTQQIAAGEPQPAVQSNPTTRAQTTQQVAAQLPKPPVQSGRTVTQSTATPSPVTPAQAPSGGSTTTTTRGNTAISGPEGVIFQNQIGLNTSNSSTAPMQSPAPIQTETQAQVFAAQTHGAGAQIFGLPNNNLP